MKPPDKGLLLSSRVDFTIPSPFAREHLYYLIQYRRYQCVPVYEVKRDFLDMYLCAYVRSGSLHAFCGEQSADAAAGQLVLMDCRLPTGSLFRRRKRGFNSASHFSRVFRSRENMTPSKFLSMNF